MNKNAFLVIGLVGAGIGGYLLYRRMSIPKTTQAITKTGSAQNISAQPGMVYPYTQSSAPRVDNANQPWYGGNQQAATGKTQSPAEKIGLDMSWVQKAQDVSAAASITKNVADIWDNLSNLWGDSEDPSTASGMSESGGTGLFGTDWSFA